MNRIMVDDGKNALSGAAKGIEGLVTLYIDTIRSMIDAIPTGQGAGQPGMGSRQEILMLLAKAQVTWLTSGLRYWRQLAEIVGRGGLGLIDVATRAGDTNVDGQTARTMRQLVLIDKARACLREVGEASLSEAETLRRELQKIEQELRATQDPGQGPQGKRVWRTKP